MSRQEFEDHQWAAGDKVISYTSIRWKKEREVLGVDFERCLIKVKGFCGRRVWLFAGDVELVAR